MTDRELMQQALDALTTYDGTNGEGKRKRVLATLRERLAQPNDFNPDWDAMVVMVEEQQRMAKRIAELEAQPEQEPVAWANEIIDDLHALHDSEMIRDIDSGDALIRLDAAIAAVEEAEQRYTAPPQRKPLTVEEIKKLIHPIVMADLSDEMTDFEIVRAIEAAHGIGEKPDAA